MKAIGYTYTVELTVSWDDADTKIYGCLTPVMVVAASFGEAQQVAEAIVKGEHGLSADVDITSVSRGMAIHAVQGGLS